MGDSLIQVEVEEEASIEDVEIIEGEDAASVEVTEVVAVEAVKTKTSATKKPSAHSLLRTLSSTTRQVRKSQETSTAQEKSTRFSIKRVGWAIRTS